MEISNTYSGIEARSIEASSGSSLRLPACLLGIVALAAQALPLLGQQLDLPYESGSTGADGALTIPDTLPLWSSSSTPLQVAYDESLGYLLASGEADENSNHLVTYGYIEGEWVELSVERYLEQVTFAYHAALGKTVRFGGVDNQFSDRYSTLTEVWTGEEWDFYDTEDRPSGRGLAAMAYDAARQEIVMFGGEGDDGELGDTWTFDGVNWTQQSPANNPEPRESATMAYDAARQEVVLFGGEGPDDENETWTWDGANWTKQTPSSIPSEDWAAMDYDPNREVVVMLLSNYDFQSSVMETWEWDGSDWTLRSPETVPEFREYNGVVWNPETERIQLFNGSFESTSDKVADSWSWDGSDWTQKAVSPFVIDMSGRPDGIWNYTTIDIGQTVVAFLPNAANTPVTWLANGAVKIEGTISLDGRDGYGLLSGEDELINTPAPGGPGGYAGGLGGYSGAGDLENSGGFPGLGPGGGIPSLYDAVNGEWDGQHGVYHESYGSPSLIALSGGSGGGGGRTARFPDDFGNIEWERGGNGGGGGGAILIASSRDIDLTGRISAQGGEGGIARFRQVDSSSLRYGSTRGGSGSGGAIRLAADRIVGNGFLDVSTDAVYTHDYDEDLDNSGRVRVEAYYIDVNWNEDNASISLDYPRRSELGTQAPALHVSSVAGQGVSTTPSTDPASPEVTFSEAGPIDIEVAGQNVPDGTMVTVRVTSGSEIIVPEAVALAGGTATFSLTVSAGTGSVQAYADWSVSP